MKTEVQAKKEAQDATPSFLPVFGHPIDCDSSANDMELKVYLRGIAVKGCGKAKPDRRMRAYRALGLCDGRTSDMLISFGDSTPARRQPSDHTYGKGHL